MTCVTHIARLQVEEEDLSRFPEQTRGFPRSFSPGGAFQSARRAEFQLRSLTEDGKQIQYPARADRSECSPGRLLPMQSGAVETCRYHLHTLTLVAGN